jgi:hypothetical protein
VRSEILTYLELQHQQIKQSPPSLEILAGADETFFPGVPGIVLVLMRLLAEVRGLSEKDLQVLTILHNFDLKRADGSTAASRFFGRNFPELFPWLMSRIDDLPEPRKPRKSQNLTISIA